MINNQRIAVLPHRKNIQRNNKVTHKSNVLKENGAFNYSDDYFTFLDNIAK